MSKAELIAAAQQASEATGLTVEAVLCQYVAENGWDVPATLNFANILYLGDVGQFGRLPWHQGAKLSHRLTWGAWMIAYDSVETWTAAYKALIFSNNQEPFANAIRMSQVAGVTDPTLIQLVGMTVTEWDEGHYGGDGHKLLSLRPHIRELLGLGELPQGNQVTVPSPTAGRQDPTDSETVTFMMKLLARWYDGGGLFGRAGIHGTAVTLRALAAEAGLGTLTPGPAGYRVLTLPDGTVV